MTSGVPQEQSWVGPWGQTCSPLEFHELRFQKSEVLTGLISVLIVPKYFSGFSQGVTGFAEKKCDRESFYSGPVAFLYGTIHFPRERGTFSNQDPNASGPRETHVFRSVPNLISKVFFWGGYGSPRKSPVTKRKTLENGLQTIQNEVSPVCVPVCSRAHFFISVCVVCTTCASSPREPLQNRSENACSVLSSFVTSV